jgi:hypothetical protein
MAKRGTILATLMIKKEVTTASKLFLQICHKHALFRQLLLLRADGLDKVLHNFLVILLKSIDVSPSKEHHVR